MISKSDKPGYVFGEVYQVRKVGSHYKLFNTNGDNVGSMGATTGLRKKAHDSEKAVQAYIQNDGKKVYRVVPMEKYNNLVKPLNTETGKKQSESKKSHESIKEYIHTEAPRLKPDELVIDELKWKFLVRSAVRAKNIMMTGPSGCGKTMAAKALVKALDRPDFYFNLGATQDPRATLIGNVTFKKDVGTEFADSAFVKAIQTPNAVILLDEISRAHPDAWNILMTVLDYGQRYLRLDESPGSPIVKVAEGVTFIATANIGNEYTSTRVIDRAIKDRFVEIEMRVLTADEENTLLTNMFPDVDKYLIKALADIAGETRREYFSDDGRLNSMISTRITVEAAGLLYDGFDLTETAEIAILPFFDSDGGTDSDRSYVKQLIQKYEQDIESRKLYDNTKADDETVELDGEEIPLF